MSSVLINLIIQIVAGAAGGNATGGSVKTLNLGTLGNTIVGAIGGGVGGQILQALIPMLQSGNMDVGSIAGQVVGGGVAGALLTAIAGAVKNAMSGQSAS